jgi:hypothetical protein
MDSLEEAVAEEYAKRASPKWTDLETFSPFEVRPMLVDPISFIDAARKN